MSAPASAVSTGAPLAKPAEQTPKILHQIPVTFVAGTDMGKVVKTIKIETDGPDEEAAMTALTGLIADYFGEGE